MGQYQFPGFSVTGGDFPAANYGTSSDIPEKRIVLFDATNYIPLKSPMGVVLPTAAGGVAKTAGITIETLYKTTTAAGTRAGRVRFYGAYPVIAEGAIAAGEWVQASDTAGKEGYAKVAGAGVEAVGQAMSTAADGEEVMVMVLKSRNA